jgi:hypothetical protein
MQLDNDDDECYVYNIDLSCSSIKDILEGARAPFIILDANFDNDNLRPSIVQKNNHYSLCVYIVLPNPIPNAPAIFMAIRLQVFLSSMFCSINCAEGLTNWDLQICECYFRFNLTTQFLHCIINRWTFCWYCTYIMQNCYEDASVFTLSKLCLRAYPCRYT